MQIKFVRNNIRNLREQVVNISLNCVIMISSVNIAANISRIMSTFDIHTFVLVFD